jgi:hypothetical protein
MKVALGHFSYVAERLLGLNLKSHVPKDEIDCLAVDHDITFYVFFYVYL